MSLRDHVMAAMAKHHLHMKSIAAKALTNKTGEAGDEATSAPRSAPSIKPKHSAKHRGFKAVQGKIQAEGYSKKIAGAILAARTRAASAGVKHANPRLLRVKG